MTVSKEFANSLTVSLENVLTALNGITVSGYNNMDALLGSMQEITRVVRVIKNKMAEEEKQEQEGAETAKAAK